MLAVVNRFLSFHSFQHKNCTVQELSLKSAIYTVANACNEVSSSTPQMPGPS